MTGRPAAVWDSGPLLFGQMREDPAAELAALDRLAQDRPPRILCIASAGCTALTLAATLPDAAVTAVDISPAQVALSRLKLALLRALPADEALAALDVDARPALARLHGALPAEELRFWQRRSRRLARGLDHAGRVDRAMRVGRRLFQLLVVGRRSIRRLLALADPEAQARLFERRWQGWRWRSIFRLGLSQPVLRAIYGPMAGGLPADCASQMRQRMERFLTAAPAAGNSYLWQAFLGRYPPGAGPPYLAAGLRERFAGGVGVDFRVADAADWLAARPLASLDFAALSNVLEVADEAECLRLLEAAARALAPGGLACLRLMFPRALPDCPELERLPALEEELTAIDRSFFCNRFRVYRRS